MAYRDVVLADNPVGYWRLNETSGTNANDEVGTNDGTYSGTFVLGQAGLLTGDPDLAVNLNATGYVRAAQIVVPTSISWEGWINVSSWPTNSSIIGQDNGSTGSLLLIGNAGGGTLYMYVNAAALSVLLPAAGVRRYLVGTYDGANAALYIDGVLAAGPTALTGPITSPAIPLEMGAYNNGGGDRPAGRLDEVAYYNVALTAAQVARHYMAGIGARVPRPSPYHQLLAS